eukprot:s556_g20.t1
MRKSTRNSSKQRMPQRRRSKSMFTTEPIGRQAQQVLEVENMEVQTAEGHCHRAEERSGEEHEGIKRWYAAVTGYKMRCLEERCAAMKDEQKRCDEEPERMAFLEAHLPGMREALSSSEKSSPKGKAAISFKQAVFCKGHVFLKQNEPAEDITYIVVKGNVEFLRSELMAPPRSILGHSRPGNTPEREALNTQRDHKLRQSRRKPSECKGYSRDEY